MNILPQIGHFELERQIARGSIGAVYLARDCLRDRPVVIKALRPEHRESKILADQIRCEGLMLARVQSAHVVTAHEVLESEAYGPLLSMQPINGSTLAKKIARGKLAGSEEVVRLGVQLCDALTVLHNDAQIVHRDIKPANIMITPENVAILVDFGMAASIESPRRRWSTKLVGTADYLAPEQCDISSDRKLTTTDLRRGDLYALGMTLYEALCGVLPFESGEVGQVLALHRFTDPAPPSTFLPAIDPGLDAVILRALERDPLERWQSCEDLGAALRATL